MKGSELLKIAVKHIETKYSGYVVNVIAAGKNGTPDLIACINGQFFAFELKGDSDKVSKLQEEQLNRIALANGYGGYVYAISDIDNIINNKLIPKIKYKNIRISL